MAEQTRTDAVVAFDAPEVGRLRCTVASLHVLAANPSAAAAVARELHQVSQFRIGADTFDLSRPEHRWAVEVVLAAAAAGVAAERRAPTSRTPR